MNLFPHISRMGEQAFLIRFDPQISNKLLERLLVLKKLILDKSVKEEVEVINTYDSLLVIYHRPIEDAYSRLLALEDWISAANAFSETEKNLFYIPVCYEEEFSLDLDEIAINKKMSKDHIVHLHTKPVYTVFFTGFLPGFLYLGGLDEKLHFPRKDKPRPRVQKGAVGIGEKQTGIYPQNSPGGWQIIGNSPVNLFDKYSVPPCEIEAGDMIKFFPIDRNEHRDILQRVEQREYSIKKDRI